MEIKIIEVTESSRGCGERKEGGAYIRIYDDSQNSEEKEIVLTQCSCCGEGLKQQRGVNIVSIEYLQEQARKVGQTWGDNQNPATQVAINWIGEKFYSPEGFKAEAIAMGVSRRLNSVPNGIEDFSEFFVGLAHTPVAANGFTRSQPKKKSKTVEYKTPVVYAAVVEGIPVLLKRDTKVEGILFSFKRARLEYVCSKSEVINPTARMINLVKRGVTLVDVVNVPQGKVQTKPLGDGTWGVFQDGEYMKLATTTTRSINENQAYMKVGNKKK